MINMLPGDGIEVSDVALFHPICRHPLHRLDQDLPAPMAERRSQHRPLSGLSTAGRETGGKDFVVAHPSAIQRCCVQPWSEEPLSTRAKMLSRVSGVHCSQCLGSMGDELVDDRGLEVGDVRDSSNFTSAVIDRRAFTKHAEAIERPRILRTPRSSPVASPMIGKAGTSADLIISDNPRNDIFTTEYFGPIRHPRVRRRRLRGGPR